MADPISEVNEPTSDSAALANGSVLPLMTICPREALAKLIPDSGRTALGLYSNTRLLSTESTLGGIRTTTFRTSERTGHSAIYVHQDGYALEIVGKGPGNELIFKVELRDRRLDGMGASGEQSPLNHFTVNHEVANGLAHPMLQAAEISVYSYQTDRYLPSGDLRDFITDPDAWMFPWHKFSPQRFFPLWQQALDSGNAPWQPAPPLKGFALGFINQAAALLSELGYHQVESVCGWYNDVTFFLKHGYSFC